MKYNNILLTGSSGTLGKRIISSGHFKNLSAPERSGMDVTSAAAVERFFSQNDFDAVIHCAAMARASECEQNPIEATKTNIIGTANLVAAVIKKEAGTGKKIRFIHISTDGVYQSARGNYSETDEAVPYNIYGWTKLGAESAVNLLTDFCIIRTRFFDPENIKYEYYATDAYTSAVPVEHLAKAIATMLESSFTGIINIGGERQSDYELYKRHKQSIKPCKFEDLQSKVPFKLSKDASMNVSLWKKLQRETK